MSVLSMFGRFETTARRGLGSWAVWQFGSSLSFCGSGPKPLLMLSEHGSPLGHADHRDHSPDKLHDRDNLFLRRDDTEHARSTEHGSQVSSDHCSCEALIPGNEHMERSRTI